MWPVDLRMALSLFGMPTLGSWRPSSRVMSKCLFAQFHRKDLPHNLTIFSFSLATWLSELTGIRLGTSSSLVSAERRLLSGHSLGLRLHFKSPL